jgi:hypothetical protein
MDRLVVRRLALAAVAGVLGLTAQAASATPFVNVTGSFSDSYAALPGFGANGNATVSTSTSNSAAGSVTGSGSTGAFNMNLTPNTYSSAQNFIAISPQNNTSCSSGSFAGYSGKLCEGTVTLTFSNLMVNGHSVTVTSGNATETGTAVFVWGSPNYDQITWSTANDPLVLGLSNGHTLDIKLNNWYDWTMYPQIAFDYDPVPEPASLIVLGSAVAALGAMRRRRRVAAA